MPLIQLGLFVLLAGFSFWIASSPGSLAYVNLPIDKGKLSAGQSVRVRLLTARGLSVSNLLILGLLTFVNYTILQAGVSGHGPGGALMTVTLGIPLAILVIVGWLIGALRRITRS